MCTIYFNNALYLTLLFSVNIKNQQKLSHYTDVFIPVTIQTLCMFFFAAWTSLCLKRFFFILTHSFATIICGKHYLWVLLTAPSSSPHCVPTRKTATWTLTQLRASLNLYVVSTAVDQFFTFIDLVFTNLYRLTAAGHTSAEEELLRKRESKLRLPDWTGLFVKGFQGSSFTKPPIYRIIHRSSLDAKRPSKKIVDSQRESTNRQFFSAICPTGRISGPHNFSIEEHQPCAIIPSWWMTKEQKISFHAFMI